jgi:hypothetical protein
MPDVLADDRRSALGWVKHIGDLRDGLLVCATLLYGLGYFVWSLNAWQNNLGLLPLIESQYLVAGVVPALILWLAYLGLRLLTRLKDHLPSWIGPGVKGWKLAGRLLTVACFWGSLAVFLGIFTPWFQDRFPEWTRSGLLVSCAILVVTTVLYSGSERRTDRVQNLYANLYTYFIPYGLAVVAIFAYVAVHRTLPHEFGGARPRCAYLDVTRAKMSDESLRDVVPADAVDGPRQVVRSNRLFVYFSGRDFMLVRPFVADPRGGGRVTPHVYEIARGVIEAVNWCDRDMGRAGGRS